MFINFQSSIFFQPVIVVVVILFKNIYMDQPMNLVNLLIIGRRKCLIEQPQKILFFLEYTIPIFVFFSYFVNDNYICIYLSSLTVFMMSATSSIITSNDGELLVSINPPFPLI